MLTYVQTQTPHSIAFTLACSHTLRHTMSHIFICSHTNHMCLFTLLHSYTYSKTHIYTQRDAQPRIVTYIYTYICLHRDITYEGRHKHSHKFIHSDAFTHSVCPHSCSPTLTPHYHRYIPHTNTGHIYTQNHTRHTITHCHTYTDTLTDTFPHTVTQTHSYLSHTGTFTHTHSPTLILVY